MATFHSTPISCGVIEVHGLPYIYKDSDFDNFLKEFYWYCFTKRHYSGLFRTLVWSTTPGNEITLAEYMARHGALVRSSPVFNHTHNSTIQTFIWNPSDACEAYTLKLVGKKKDPDVDKESTIRTTEYWNQMVGHTRESHCVHLDLEYEKQHPIPGKVTVNYLGSSG